MNKKANEEGKSAHSKYIYNLCMMWMKNEEKSRIPKISKRFYGNFTIIKVSLHSTSICEESTTAYLLVFGIIHDMKFYWQLLPIESNEKITN